MQRNTNCLSKQSKTSYSTLIARPISLRGPAYVDSRPRHPRGAKNLAIQVEAGTIHHDQQFQGLNNSKKVKERTKSQHSLVEFVDLTKKTKDRARTTVSFLERHNISAGAFISELDDKSTEEEREKELVHQLQKAESTIADDWTRRQCIKWRINTFMTQQLNQVKCFCDLNQPDTRSHFSRCAHFKATDFIQPR